MSTVNDKFSLDGSAPLLSVRNLTKRSGGEGAAIDRVSFSAVSGEILGIIGPNGAGKTTLLEAIAGLLPVNSGEVLWRGEELRARRRRDVLFYLPDGVRPYRDQSALQVISFIWNVFRRSDADVSTMINALGLPPVLRKRVHALSKGYARRLMLILGLLAPHEVLLMDEPFDGLDWRQTRDMIGVLRSQTERGRTLILSIHQLADAERVCDRLILLSAGRVRSATLRNCARRPGCRRGQTPTEACDASAITQPADGLRRPPARDCLGDDHDGRRRPGAGRITKLYLDLPPGNRDLVFSLHVLPGALVSILQTGIVEKLPAGTVDVLNVALDDPDLLGKTGHRYGHGSRNQNSFQHTRD